MSRERPVIGEIIRSIKVFEAFFSFAINFVWQTAKVAYHLLAQIVTARLTDVALETWNARLDSHHVTHLNILHFVTDLNNTSTRFVAWQRRGLRRAISNLCGFRRSAVSGATYLVSLDSSARTVRSNLFASNERRIHRFQPWLSDVWNENDQYIDQYIYWSDNNHYSLTSTSERAHRLVRCRPVLVSARDEHL